MMFYAFDAGMFWMGLVQTIKESQANQLQPYIGEHLEGLSENQRNGKLKLYKEGYSVYTDVHESAAGYQFFYANWPTGMFLQLFGRDSDQLKKALNGTYPINSYEYNESDGSLVAKLQGDKDVIVIQVLEYKNTQIIGLAFAK